MATMNISLPDSLKQLVDEEVLRNLIAEGLAYGPGLIADDAFFAELREIAAGRTQP